jgi:hypothetical protein
VRRLPDQPFAQTAMPAAAQRAAILAQPRDPPAALAISDAQQEQARSCLVGRREIEL